MVFFEGQQERSPKYPVWGAKSLTRGYRVAQDLIGIQSANGWSQ